MCLLAFAWRVHPDYPLIVVANRDEFHARPTAPLAFWDDQPAVCAGRDLKDGGTWLGVTRTGRFSALTNFREMPLQTGEFSRGAIVRDALISDAPATAVAAEVAARGEQFAGFNALIGDGDELVYLSNRAADGPRVLRPGVYGLSNALLDTGWPKLCAVREGLQAWLADSAASMSFEPLLAMMRDESEFPDADLPDTGVGVSAERMLSARFIKGDHYGTRCTTIALLGARECTLLERRYDAGGVESGETLETFTHRPPESA